MDVGFGRTVYRCCPRVVDEFPCLFRQAGIQTTYMVVYASAGRRLCAWRRALFGKRSDVLEGTCTHRCLSLYPAAVWLGKSLSQKIERNGKLDMVDRYSGDLSCQHLSACVLDDALAEKFRLVCEG